LAIFFKYSPVLVVRSQIAAPAENKVVKRQAPTSTTHWNFVSESEAALSYFNVNTSGPL
jgi:hypothetical protein